LGSGRLVDVLPARHATAVTDWLSSKPSLWLAGINRAVIDPYQPYAATAVATVLPDARLIVDHCHVIRLANAALDEVRRQTQRASLRAPTRPTRRIDADSWPATNDLAMDRWFNGGQEHS
jgi:transposase